MSSDSSDLISFCPPLHGAVFSAPPPACLTSGPLHKSFPSLWHGSPPYLAPSHSSSRAQSQACITLWAPLSQSWAHSGSGGTPLGLDSSNCHLPCLTCYCSGSPLWLDCEPLESRDWVSRPPATGTSWCLVNIYGMDEKWTPKPLALSAVLWTYCMQGSVRGAWKTKNLVE